MKYLSFTLAIILTVLFVYGCDSVSDSKPVGTTPPTLTTPADNDTTVPVMPVFRWSGSADKLEISTSSAFGTSVIHSVTVSDSVYIYNGAPLDPERYYYWHAGITAGNKVYWSDIFTFKTQ